MRHVSWMVPLMSVTLLAAAPDPKAHQAEVDAWHQERVARLQSEEGWLSVVGLPWLQEGMNRAGSDGSAQVKFPQTAPRLLGSFTRNGDHITFTAEKGVPVTSDGKPVESLVLASDDTGKPTMLKHGTFTFHVIKRGAKMGVRIKDTASPARTGFQGIQRYPVDGKWRVTAKWVPSNPPRKIRINTIIDTSEDIDAPGTAVFTVDGKEYRLEPVVEPGSSELFFIFADQTSGKDTYGAGRFLYTPMPKDGVVVVDFNKAYSPPCAFTRFATCPLPPPQNRLAVAVTAGEKTYTGPH